MALSPLAYGFAAPCNLFDLDGAQAEATADQFQSPAQCSDAVDAGAWPQPHDVITSLTAGRRL
jgi:hypothetical protein